MTIYKVWQKKTEQEIKDRVFSALRENVDYEKQHVLGVPASYLDDKVFYQDVSFIKDAPFISTLIQNPNHIGCHTLGESEPFFKGTQDIERELIDICAMDILEGESGSYDGYVAAGGTEANMQAIWIYRNFFMHERQAELKDIAILCSADSHYSMDKAANVMMLDLYRIPVQNDERTLTTTSVKKTVELAQKQGKKYIIVICNMMTTMFGGVDCTADFTEVLDETDLEYKLHVDGAYGGFYYPFTSAKSELTFSNPAVTSVTLDAHKMAQAPYGTGIFLIRKNFMHYANTKEASYVEGQDFTLIGSRSGANAVAVWMILVKKGPYGWKEKTIILQERTKWLCQQLDDLNWEYYRHPYSNIITIKSQYIPAEIAREFGLVPDTHGRPNWYKIVVMEHVTIEKLLLFLDHVKSRKTEQ